LQLTDYFVHEHEVDHYVIRGVLELVLDAHQPKLVSHLVVFIKNVQCFEDRDEAALATFELGPHQITHFEYN